MPLELIGPRIVNARNLKIIFCLLKAVDGRSVGGAAALGMFPKSAYSDFL